MGRLDLATLEEKMEFGKRFLPPGRGFMWRLASPGEFAAFDAPTSSYFGAYVGQFLEGGLRLPLDPLIVMLMGRMRIAFSYLGLNVIRVIMSMSALNRLLNLKLGLREILYCYRLMPSKISLYNFQSYPNAPDLIKCLPESSKGILESAIVVLEGLVLPATFEKFKFLKVHGASGMASVTTKLRIDHALLNHNHLNCAINHEGYDITDLFDHPRACYNLLGYQWRNRQVNTRTKSDTWVDLQYDKEFI